MTQEAKVVTPTARILLVEDDADTRDLLKQVLIQRYEVDVVADGIAFWSTVHRLQHLPDLVLANVMMTGRDGFKVLRSLRTDPHTRELPIILLSAQADEEACIAGLEAGADDYVTKPFSERELLARVEANLRIARLRQQIEAEKQQLLEQAQAERGFLEAVLQQMPAGVIIAEAPSGKLILGNERVEQIWRHPFLSASNIEQYPKYQGFHPDDRPYQPEEWPLARSLTKGEVVIDEEITIRRGDGTRGMIQVSSAPIRDALGSITAGVVTFYDITDRKLAQETLQHRETELRLIANALPVLIAFVDSQQRYRFNNQAYGEWFGYLATEANGKHLREVLGAPTYEVIRPYVEQVLAGQPVAFEYQIPSKGGEIRYVNANYIPQFDNRGSVEGFVALVSDISDRKEAEKALRQSEERFQAFMNNSPAAAWITDVDGRILYLSQTYFRLFDFPANDAIGKSVFELYPAEIAQQFLDNIKTVAQTNQVIETIEVAPRTDGTMGDFLVYKFPIVDTSEQRLVGGVAIDVTKRKQAEEALQASEERFRVIVNQAAVGIVQTDLTGQFVLVNQRYCDIVGYPMAELLQKRMHDITHPDDLERDTELFQRVVMEPGTDFSIEKRYIRKDGSSVWVSNNVAATYDASGNPQYAIAVVLDISDRKRAEAERAQLLAREQQQTRRLQKLTEASLSIYSTLSLNERLRLITDQARDLIEAHQSVTSLTVNENWAQGIHTVSLSDKYAQWREYDQKPDGSGIYTLACRMQRPIRMTQAELVAHPAWRNFGKEAGKHPPMRGWLAAPLTSSNGKNIGLIQLSDKYEREFTQEDEAILVQLAQMASAAIDNARLYEESQQVNRLKDEFLAVLSHELRSPLNPILGWSKLLRSRKLDEKTTDHALETIERSAQIQTKLIEDLLDVSRILQGKLSLNVCPVDLTSTIQAAMETVQLAASAKSVELQTRLEPDVGQVAGDPNRLQQVIWNLLSNAVKFTPQGGRVDIQLERLGSQVQITVSDTGMGISSDFLPHVFGYFRQADSTTTRKFGGLGLGLAIVSHLVELHGGTVQAESPGEGQGATFRVRLPLMPTPPKKQQDTRQSEQSPDLSGVKLLVVDDDASTREFISVLLELHGATVTAVASAGEAFAALAQVKPDVLLSDIGMPEVDGYMLMQQVRTLPPEQGGQVRAIALTAYAGEINYQQALSAGFQRHVPKPVEPAKLVEVIADLVGHNK